MARIYQEIRAFFHRMRHAVEVQRCVHAKWAIRLHAELELKTDRGFA